MKSKPNERRKKERRVQYASGAERCAQVAGEKEGGFPLRYDLIFGNITGLRRLAATFGEGSLKYGDDNYKKGLPESDLINHTLAHLAMHRSGDKTEDHLGHATWNLFTLMFMQDERPEMMDVTGDKQFARKSKK